MAGKGAMNFGSKARAMNKDKNKITFKDVAGVEEAKDEVFELVDFLKDPKIPKTRRPYSEGHFNGGLSRHRQNTAGQGHCGRG